MRAPEISHRSFLLPLTLSGCWAVWIASNALAWIFKAPDRAAYALRYSAVNGLIGLATCGLLFLLYGRLRRHLDLAPFVILIAPLCFVAGVFWNTATSLAMWGLGWNDQLWLDPKGILVGGGMHDGLTLALFSLLFLAVDHWRLLCDQRERARAATTLATQAQLQMLRYQLNPHFLFNALNSIRAMIMREPERARQIVTELAEFLRYSLNGRGQESTLGEEMQAIENYLAIQRIRFDERLAVTVRVDPGLMHVVLPCFLVHPLVENAIKYGMETSPPPLHLEIEVMTCDGDLRLRVSNTGRLLDAPPAGAADRNGTGTGLKNVAQRLALAFPDRHAFSLREAAGWVHAEITLRLDTAKGSP